MKNFSELLDTDFVIEIQTVVDGVIVKNTVPLLKPIKLEILGSLTSIKIDSFDVMPYVWHQNSIWYFEIDQPFYQWRHTITGQGWLLKPQ